MSHPKRADHFREWSKLMLEQALVPERVQYKSAGVSSASTKSVKGMKKRSRKRNKRFLRRNRNHRKD